jgi:hypothetical protein
LFEKQISLSQMTAPSSVSGDSRNEKICVNKQYRLFQTALFCPAVSVSDDRIA